MKFTLEFDMDNAAFDEGNDEAPRILRKLAGTIEDFSAGSGGKIRDINGNTVGHWEVTE
jgi:hypothetical protein